MPVAFTCRVMPISRCPGREHQPSTSPEMTPRSSSFVSPAASDPEDTPVSNTRSWRWSPEFVKSMMRRSPTGTSMWFGVNAMPSTPTDTRVVCPVGVTDEAVVPVPVPVPCVVGADGLDRKIARASATTETTPTIAPAVRLTGE